MSENASPSKPQVPFLPSESERGDASAIANGAISKTASATVAPSNKRAKLRPARSRSAPASGTGTGNSGMGNSGTGTTRWKEIADAVQLDIEMGRLAVGDLLPSETALTEKWKVSRMTAHRAMQELQRGGLVTRQRGRGTLVAAGELKKTGNIALLFHNPLDQLEVEYIRGINLGLRNEHRLVLCDSHADIKQEFGNLEAMQLEADGIICMPSCNTQNTPLLRKMVASGYPIVCVDRVPQDLQVDAVVSDNYGATAQALRDLIARGHRRIAHFTEDAMHISAVRERHQAFLDVMRESGIDQPERLVRFSPSGAENKFETLVQLMHDALFTLRHQAEPITALFCLNDYCLTILMAAAEQDGLSFPEDVEILSFLDTLTLRPSESARLHRIVQEPRKIGQLAAEMLKKRMAEPDQPYEVVRVSPSIHSLQADFPSPAPQHSRDLA